MYFRSTIESTIPVDEVIQDLCYALESKITDFYRISNQDHQRISNEMAHAFQ